MEKHTPRLPRILSPLRNKVNFFYLLAFMPLLLLLYYDLWILVVAIYGFIFLLLKNQKLETAKEAKLSQRILGIMIIIGSFFVRYALILIVPQAVFYGTTNYAVTLFGLFLVFFDLSTLKEAFTPLFFIVAGTSSFVISNWLEPYFSPYLDDFAYLIANILRALGVNALVRSHSTAPVISFLSLSGSHVAASVVYECLGIFGALVFSIILVVVLFEDSSSWKIRVLASGIGVLGTFALNVLRVTLIFVTDYFYGAEVGAKVHYVIGYALFSAWVAVFLFIYSKRKAIQTRIQTLWQRLNLSAFHPKST